MSQQNVDLVQRGFELVNRGDAIALSQFIDKVCDPAAEVKAIGRLPDVSRVRGQEAIKAWFAELLGTLDMRLEIEEVLDADDSVVAVVRQIAQGRASGAGVANRVAFVFRFADGRFVCMEGYRTRKEAREAVGLRE